MADNVPQWANERALVLAGGMPIVGDGENTLLTAFARYIAEHEHPPVDPLLIEARNIVAKWWEDNANEVPTHWQRFAPGDFRSGARDSSAEVTQALAGLRRGIEIGRGQ